MMGTAKESPAALAGAHRADSEVENRDDTEPQGKAQRALAREAAAWASQRKAGRPRRDHFLILPDGRLWALHINPARDRPSVVTGLTRAEANRERMPLSDRGYIGLGGGGG